MNSNGVSSIDRLITSSPICPAASGNALSGPRKADDQKTKLATLRKA